MPASERTAFHSNPCAQDSSIVLATCRPPGSLTLVVQCSHGSRQWAKRNDAPSALASSNDARLVPLKDAGREARRAAFLRANNSNEQIPRAEQRTSDHIAKENSQTGMT